MKSFIVLTITITIMVGVSLRATAADRPNVLAIFYDDMGYGDLGANLPTGLTIPHDDLKNDPGERVNLLIEPSAAAKAKEQELYELLNRIRGDEKMGSELSRN